MNYAAAAIISILLISSAAAEVEFRDDEDVQYHTGLDMNQNPLIGLSDPEEDSEPVPYGFLSQGYVRSDGDSMTDDLEMQGNIIDMEQGNIEDVSQIETTDISGLQFLVPDEELQITEDVDISGGVQIEDSLTAEGSLTSHARFIEVSETSDDPTGFRIEQDNEDDPDRETLNWQIGTRNSRTDALFFAPEYTTSRSGFRDASILELREDFARVRDDLNVDNDVDVGGSIDVGGNAVYARNIRGGSGASMYFEDSSGNDVLRMRNGDGRFYNDIIVGDASESPDASLDVRGDSIFEEDINLDGNSLQNVEEISGDAGEPVTVDGDLEVDGRINDGFYQSPDCVGHEYQKGEGSSSEPYIVLNAHDLQCIENDLDAYYELGRDIDAAGTRYWSDGEGFEPINGFGGSFEGNHHTISDIYIDLGSSSGAGLFEGASSGAEFQNIRLDNFEVYGDEYVGALAGDFSSSTEITNISVTDVKIKATGVRVGGLAGRPGRSNINNSRVIGGEVTSTSGNVGGLAGRTSWDAGIYDSYTVGVTVEGSSSVGGVIGHTSGNDGVIERIFSASEIFGEGNGAIGNIASDDDIDAVYFDEDAAGTSSSSDEGEALSTEQLTNHDAGDSLEEFDFEEVWKTQTYDYPGLRWEYNE